MSRVKRAPPTACGGWCGGVRGSKEKICIIAETRWPPHSAQPALVFFVLPSPSREADRPKFECRPGAKRTPSICRALVLPDAPAAVDVACGAFVAAALLSFAALHDRRSPR